MDGSQTLQLGRYDPLSQSLTTDHPCRDSIVGRAGFPPPPAPPPAGGGGGGDDHLPGRLEVLLVKALTTAAALLLASAIADVLGRPRVP